MFTRQLSTSLVFVSSPFGDNGVPASLSLYIAIASWMRALDFLITSISPKAIEYRIVYYVINVVEIL